MFLMVLLLGFQKYAIVLSHTVIILCPSYVLNSLKVVLA